MDVGDLNVLYVDSPFNFVLPDSEKLIENTGSGNGFEEKPLVPRVRFLYELLNDLGIEQCSVYEGVCSDTQFRRVPYVLFVIEELDRAVLLCEENGNRTFVKAGIENLEDFSFSKKSELKKRSDVRHFTWSGEENWKENMLGCLIDDFSEDLPENLSDEVLDDSLEDVPSEFQKMDSAYFTEENVRIDLEEFSKELGLTSIDALNTGKAVSKINVKCTNGEIVRFQTSLNRAAKVFGFSRNESKATLNKLKELCGIEVEE